MNKIVNFENESKRLGILLDEVKLIETVLKKYGGKLFLIGGNVRDLILKNAQTTHSDLVCDLPINKVVKALNEKKIKISKVGLKYGSIVVHLKKVSFDITSMRKDLETDGRFAKIKFTNDIIHDARRRDFTINSIYCDMDGNLIDPLNGIKDLKEKKIKFIGRADDRIKEDYLRILRFIRFSLLYSKKFNSDGFIACKKYQKNISKLSFERRINELGKILTLKNIEDKNVLKKLTSFFSHALNSNIDIHNFEKLCKLEKKLGRISKVRRIKFLTRNVKEKLKFLNVFSKKSKDRILYKFNFKKNTEYQITKEILDNTEDQIYDSIIINYADGLIDIQKANFLIKKTIKLKKKLFPINGRDLLDLGFRKGKKIGEILAEIEEWWIKNDLKPKKNQCLKYAKEKLPSS